jgi:hypothetical protein
MSAQVHSIITEAWRKAAEETAKALSVARAIERKQYPEGDAPAGLLPALALAVSIHYINTDIVYQFGRIEDAIQNVARVTAED